MEKRQVLSLAARSFWVRCLNVKDSFLARYLLWRFGAHIGHGLNVCGRLRCYSKGVMVIGNDVRINSGPDRNFVGGDRRTNIWVGPGARLEIEDKAAISNTTIITRTSVCIRHSTFIGGGCDIYDNDFHQIHSEDRETCQGNIGVAPVTIGPRAFVGGHSIILKGVNIGEGAVIGAGSLVSKDVPPFQVWAGRPAIFVKELGKSQKENV
jgi:acetyltransferase-like isoleucine patch superfamily enzyme